MSKLKTKINYFINFVINLSLIVLLLLTVSCNFLTRFRHEKYECPYNSLKIQEVIINKEKIGSEITMIQNDNSLKLQIIESSKFQIISTGDDFKLEIDRESAEIKYFKQKSFKTLKCKKTLLKF